jgi:hypothetical protein
LDLETEIMKLPFTSEVYALPIALAMQRPFIGVLVRMQQAGFLAASALDEELPSFVAACVPDLQATLQTLSQQYQVPVALHILRKTDILPRKRNGNKVQRQETASIYFSLALVQGLEFDFHVGLDRS